MGRQMKKRRLSAASWALGFLAMIALAGCFGGGDGASGRGLSDSAVFSDDAKMPRAELVRQKSVMGGKVTIAAPKGFCIDTTAHRDTESGAFVPIGACAALTKDPRDPKPAKPAFLTATVLPMPVEATALPRDPDARMRAARGFMESQKGRAALSRVGRAETVTVLDMKSSKNVLYIRAADQSEGLPAALSDTTWRAFFELNGMLVTASATAFTDHPLDTRKTQSLLAQFVATIRKANGDASGGGGLKGLLGDLLD